MTNLVEVPFWLVVVAGGLALIAVLDRLLLPSVRWFLRRRLNRAIEELNKRLQLGIQPFKLTRRKVMIDRLAHDPKVMEAVVSRARKEGVPREVVAGLAENYAREIAPSFSVGAYFGFGIRLARALSESFFHVRLAYVDEDALKDVDPDATIVFVMNHRSNMDYILVTYLAAQRAALSYAVGEWANFWPLRQLIRSMGAYFIRRNSANPLYRRVLSRYVQMATEAGVSQAIFPEGRLSLDGKLAPVKLGLLSYILGGFNPETSRDVIFIPIGLNYDRVLEDRSLTTVDEEGRRNFKLSVGTILGILWKQIWLRLIRRFKPYGYACVTFGRPLSLKEFVENQKGATEEQSAKAFGELVMGKVAQAIPVLPVPLVAAVILDADRPLTRPEVGARGLALLRSLEDEGAFVYLPGNDADMAVEAGLNTLTMRHLVTREDGLFKANEVETDLLAYYANSIAHLRK